MQAFKRGYMEVDISDSDYDKRGSCLSEKAIWGFVENLEAWDENILFLLVFVGIELCSRILFVFHCVGWAQYNAMENRGRDKGKPQEVTATRGDLCCAQMGRVPHVRLPFARTSNHANPR